MIKRMTQWSPREGMSREQALRYWREGACTASRESSGSYAYVQNLIPGPDGAEPPYAGLGEVWFESLPAVRTAMESAEWHAVITDAATFMDTERISAAWADEHAVF